jgi:hypothetical protein
LAVALQGVSAAQAEVREGADRIAEGSAGLHADAEPGARYRLAQSWRGAPLSARANQWEAGICGTIAHGSLLVIAGKRK